MKRTILVLGAAALILAIGIPAYATDGASGDAQEEPRQYVTENAGPSGLAAYVPTTGSGTDAIIQITEDPTDSPAVLKDVRMVDEGNQHLIIKTFDIPPEFEPENLVEEDFRKNGYNYKKCYLLQMSENYAHETKLASQTVTVSHDKKGEAISKLAPLMDYSQDGFVGQLTLNANTIFTEPADQSSYTYNLNETREYPGFEHNDTYGVPKTIDKNGAALQLVDVSWTPMGDGRYTAVASYTGTATGTTVKNYTSTATYVGQVNKDILKSITYAVVYEGSPIPLPPPDYWPYILAAVIVCALATLSVVLFIRRKNCKILAYYGGRYNIVQRMRLSYFDPIIDLTHTSLNSKEYLVVIDRWASKRLSGQSIRIICADGTVKEHRLEGNAYGCKLRLESDEFYRGDFEASAQV